ncbi:MAG TPA: hypothetical protein VFG14_11295, partial [Chthoniobacteraceae bacterium]|nr:hypothetical protein [Chthoniobacteraceae bacterium]
LEDLRARIARIEGVSTRHGSLPFSLDPIDRCLPGGGLAARALHEVAGSADLADDASATIFLAGILARITSVSTCFSISTTVRGVHSVIS